MELSLYTNIFLKGNTILERYIDENGVKRQRKVDFEPTMYRHVLNTTSELSDIYGKPVEPIKFDSISEARKWMKSMGDINREYLGMDNFIIQYAYENYSNPINYSMNQLDIAFLDIEVPTDGPFPDPAKCEYSVDGICHYSTFTKKFHLFTTRPWEREQSKLTDFDLDSVEYHFLPDEKTLLVEYLRFFKQNTPDIVSGWNSDQFDIPYLINRYRKILGDKFAEKFSPWDIIKERIMYIGEDDEDLEEIVTYEIAGISLIDYMAAYKKFTFKKRPNYKLETIAQAELKIGKVEMTHKTYLAFSTNDPQTYIDYLLRDVDILIKLDRRISLMQLIVNIAYYAKINFNDPFSPIKTWDAIIHNSLIERNIIVPQNKSATKQKYAGALVKDPIAAFYKWVLSFDLESLYPRLIMMYNISPDTIVDQIEVPRIFVKDRMVPDLVGMGMPDKKYVVPHDGHSYAANGMRYTKEKRGVIPAEIEKVFLQRKAAKKDEFRADKLATRAEAILAARHEKKAT